jgi:hypothetical protein
MLDNVFQPVLYEGDVCRISFLVSAVQSAPHRKIEPAAHSQLQAIYRGAIDCSTQLVSCLDRFKCENLK